MDVNTFNYPSRLPLPTFVDPTNASMDPCVDRPWKGTLVEPGAELARTTCSLCDDVARKPCGRAAPKFSYLVAIKSVEQTIQGDRTL